MLDQQPIGPFAPVAVIAHPHQNEAAMQPLALQRKLEIALSQRLLGRLVAFRLTEAAIPQHHRAAAILTLGDSALEVAIVQWVILDFDRQTLVVRIE